MRSLSGSHRRALSLVVASILLVIPAAPAMAAAHPSSDPSEITRMGSRVYFAATTAAHGRELWTSNGTAAGTFELIDINPTGSSDPGSLTVAGNRLFFTADDGSGSKLWVTDGTVGGTVPIFGGFASSLVNVGGTLYFSGGWPDNEVMTSDGTAAGTVSVEAISGFIEDAVAFQGEYYFTVSKPGSSGSAWRLWRSDGTPEGTTRVKRLAPLNGHFEPWYLVASGDRLFFIMDDQDFAGGAYPASNLWQSDGTAAGTKQVADFDSDPESPDGVYDLTNVGGTLFFTTYDEGGDRELWKTSGTEASTRRVKDINPSDGSVPDVLTRVGNRLFFSADDGTGRDLWRTKGTGPSTIKVSQAAPFRCAFLDFSCIPAGVPMTVGSRLFFPSDEGGRGIELWVSDGTEPGTHMVKNIGPGTNHSRPSNLADGGGGILYFVAKDGTHGRELWISDGTGPGTHLVKDIKPG